MDFHKINPCNSDFLRRLQYIALMPKILYYYGNLPENSGNWTSTRFPMENPGRPKTVAIVGSRKYTSYGENYAYKIAYELAKRGVIIVSGLAVGIDSIAHRAALDAGGKTIALLGTPIDKIYPAAHRGLAKEIVRCGGAIISEYSPMPKKRPHEILDEEEAKEKGVSISEIKQWYSAGFLKSTFLKRNRLISGLSDALLVVEADIRSGSLNTASHAMEQGVPLFAIPGDINRQMSRGCNALLGKGAEVCTCYEDIMQVFGGEKTMDEIEVKGDTDQETKILKLIYGGFSDGEEIVQKTGVSVSEFNVIITTLELKGKVRRLYGNKWMLL